MFFGAVIFFLNSCKISQVNILIRQILFAFKQATALLLHLFYSGICCFNFMPERPSFLNVVKNSRESKVERPNCLNFKHRNISKRNEGIEFIKNLQLPKSKLLGVAELLGKSIDVTRKSREHV